MKLDYPDENTKMNITKHFNNLYIEVNNKDEFWEEAAKSSLNLIFILLYRKHADFFPLTTIDQSTLSIIKIQKYIEEHYTENINLDDMSKLFYE